MARRQRHVNGDRNRRGVFTSLFDHGADVLQRKQKITPLIASLHRVHDQLIVQRVVQKHLPVKTHFCEIMEGVSDQTAIRIYDLIGEKLHNAKAKAGEFWGVCPDRLQAITVQDIVQGFLVIKPYWELFEGDDWSFFECSAELHEPELLQQYNALTQEQKDLTRRYIRFFLHCVQDLVKAVQ